MEDTKSAIFFDPPGLVGSSDRKLSSPLPIAAISLYPPIRLDEITLTGQSPTPFSIPLTPQAYDYNTLQDGAIEVIYDEDNSHTLVRPRLGRAAEHLHWKVLRPERPDTLMSTSMLERQERYTDEFSFSESKEFI